MWPGPVSYTHLDVYKRQVQAPINAYGGSKRALGDMLRDFSASHGLNHGIFRYCNVAGADPEGGVGEAH